MIRRAALQGPLATAPFVEWQSTQAQIELGQDGRDRSARFEPGGPDRHFLTKHYRVTVA